MSGKYALIIGNTEYTDPGLAQLTAPGKDAEDFARVLRDKEICGFDDVKVLLNQPEHIVRRAIEVYFDQKKPDDLMVLYFSGHGVRDEVGALYLAVKNTVRTRLRSTTIKSDFVREIMDQSRSKRQVLILDCCNSGAFAQGTKAATGMSIGTASAFETGYGRVILTASDSTQYAWEGDQVIGETDKSLFTHFLVEGLEGEADLDGDGSITVDELYDYAYEKVKLATPKQTPSKFSSKQQGEIVLRQNIPIEYIKPVLLPAELIDEIEDIRPYVREAAVHKLERLLKAKNIALARSAREALERIVADENTTHRVAQAATQILESIRYDEQKAEEERKATEEAEKERVARERAAQEKAERAAAIHAARLVEKQAREKAKSVPTREISQATDLKVPTDRIRPASTKFLLAGIVSVGVLVLVLFWLGSAVLRPFAIAPTESTLIVTITSTFTRAQTTAATSLVATSTDIPSLTSTGELFPSVTNNNDNSPNLVIITIPSTRVPSFTRMPIPTTPIPTPTTPIPTPTTPIPTPTTPNTETADPCGTLLPRITYGMTIQVVATIPRLGIRPQPTLGANKIFELLSGEKMTVIGGGPVCSDNSYFWPIRSDKGTGWVREGNGISIYYVEPVP